MRISQGHQFLWLGDAIVVPINPEPQLVVHGVALVQPTVGVCDATVEIDKGVEAVRRERSVTLDNSPGSLADDCRVVSRKEVAKILRNLSIPERSMAAGETAKPPPPVIPSSFPMHRLDDGGKPTL
jgi:hypothetical protein